MHKLTKSNLTPASQFISPFFFFKRFKVYFWILLLSSLELFFNSRIGIQNQEAYSFFQLKYILFFMSQKRFILIIASHSLPSVKKKYSTINWEMSQKNNITFFLFLNSLRLNKPFQVSCKSANGSRYKTEFKVGSGVVMFHYKQPDNVSVIHSTTFRFLNYIIALLITQVDFIEH